MTAQRLFALGARAVVAATLALSSGVAAAQANVVGQWTYEFNLPFAPIHDVLLPNGKVMLWGKNLDQALWDPVTKSMSTLPNPGYDLFCAGHGQLPDGKILVPGGHIADFVGLAKTSIYDPATNTWSPVPDMNAGRWYPSVTTLPNGDSLVVSGEIDTHQGTNPLPQVYQRATNTWRDLTNAQLVQGLYPMMFVAPNGKVFDAGPTHITRYLDTNGTGQWTFVANRTFGWRDYGSAVMYEPGKILVAGGGANPPTATAEVIDLNSATPTWRAVQSMSIGRRHLNMTLLPDGTVLASGGTSGKGHNNDTTPVTYAELWNPATQAWTRMADSGIARLYHSSALLLPDGRVMVTGGDWYGDVQFYSPPYLFKGARPTVSGVPSTATYGQQVTITSAQAADIRKVTLVRLSSVTHAFDMDQRLNVLPFTAANGTLTVTMPANANLAPPGNYWLFAVNSAGVPSVGALVQVGGGTTPPPAPGPTLSGLSPSSATAGGPAFTLSVDGSNFVSGAAVRWNGTARPTTFVSGTRVTAEISQADIASAQTAQVTVANPNGSVSGALPFTVSQPAAPPPALSSLSPNSATAGGPAFTLTVDGSNFVSGAAVRWNGAAKPTTYVSGTRVTAAISQADIASAQTAQVTLANPNGSVSGSLPFTVLQPAAPPPALSSLSPNSATAGGPAFTLTVDGSNFVSGAAVRWNGAARPTTFVSSTRVTAAISQADIGSAQTAQVTVANPNGAVSGALAFTVSAATAPTTYTVSVRKLGTDPSGGYVYSTPRALNCGSTCTVSFGSGSSVTLTAGTTGSTVFAGWGGACTGTAPSCTLTMDGNKSVTATFNAP